MSTPERDAAEKSLAGGLVAYVQRLRQNHRVTVTENGNMGVCVCGEPGCAKARLLLHIDDLRVAYGMKVEDLARETRELARLREENNRLMVTWATKDEQLDAAYAQVNTIDAQLTELREAVRVFFEEPDEWQDPQSMLVEGESYHRLRQLIEEKP